MTTYTKEQVEEALTQVIKKARLCREIEDLTEDQRAYHLGAIFAAYEIQDALEIIKHMEGIHDYSGSNRREPRPL